MAAATTVAVSATVAADAAAADGHIAKVIPSRTGGDFIMINRKHLIL